MLTKGDGLQQELLLEKEKNWLLQARLDEAAFSQSLPEISREQKQLKQKLLRLKKELYKICCREILKQEGISD